ncbi:MAG TPA: hypothetical protein VE871_11895 [Longimicrobium sp.]|nr:hypothetical protein [Longimicrobium sp.]
MSAPRLNPEDLMVDSLVIGGPSDDVSAAASILWNTTGQPMTGTCTEGPQCIA